MLPTASLVLCRGPRAAEARLLDEVDERRARRVAELDRPLRVVVPSASLRRHVAVRVAEALGPVAGVAVQTIHGVALEVLDRRGAPAPCADPLFELLVRRQTARDADLAGALATYDDGAAVVEGAVRDLLDAGFDAVLGEPMVERLGDLDGVLAPERVERAQGVVRVAAQVAAGLDAVGEDRAAAAVRAAAEALAGTEDLLPSRAILVHGFADVTGLVADLLGAMLRGRSGAVIVDRPPDPAARQRDDAGVVFLDRLIGGLGGLARGPDEGARPAGEITVVEAPDGREEAREVARRIQVALDGGVCPERIAVVARDLDRHGPRLRDALDALGVPYSGVGGTVSGGRARRRVERLLRLAAAAGEATLEEWTEARWPSGSDERLRLALRCLGASRLDDVAGVEVDLLPADGVEIPLLDVVEAGERPAAGRVAPSVVAAAVTAAKACLELDRDWPAAARVAAHLGRTRALLDVAGWPTDAPERGEVEKAADTVAAGLPDGMEVARSEWRDLLARRLRSAGDDPVGGEGGGVQLLSVMEARARTFELVLVVGLQRGAFPRTVTDDPVLPDAVRSRLSELLGFLPVAARSASEERYLFAQLAASAPQVVCTFAATEGGRRAAPSPFLDRLRLAGVTFARDDPADGVIRPSFDRAVELALRHGPADPFRELLAEAIEEGRSLARRPGGVPAPAVAAWRVEVVTAADAAADGTWQDPWGGRVGPVVRDPEAGPWVTDLERTATCPWQWFVTRRLRVAPLPDPRAGVPDVDHLLVGQVVHRVLQRVVDRALGERVETLGRAVTRAGVAVPWPAGAELEEITARVAETVVAEAGLGATGLAPLAAAAALPVLEVAGELEWGLQARLDGVAGAELWGEAELGGPPGRVRFRADRVDHRDGGLVAVDYKTGSPVSAAVKADTRRRHLRQRVARGRLLQAVAYAVGTSGTGRYVFLRPDVGAVPPEARLAEVAAGDGSMIEAFAESVAAVAAARTAGAMFPRVEEAEAPDRRPSHCGYCRVTEACRRDDSSFRRRLVAAMGQRSGGDPVTAAARRLWWLGVEAP